MGSAGNDAVGPDRNRYASPDRSQYGSPGRHASPDRNVIGTMTVSRRKDEEVCSRIWFNR